MTWQGGLIALVSLGAVFVLGWVMGRHTEVQRQVDAVLRRETRHRHSSGRGSTGAVPEILPPPPPPPVAAERRAEALGSAGEPVSARLVSFEDSDDVRYREWIASHRPPDGERDV